MNIFKNIFIKNSDKHTKNKVKNLSLISTSFAILNDYLENNTSQYSFQSYYFPFAGFYKAYSVIRI